jgi:uncharacterized protein YggL (DUF469 family)
MTAPCPNFGFVVRIARPPELADEERAAFWAAWIGFLESRGLCCTGGGGESEEYVVASDAAQATHLDREAVHAWLAGRSDVEHVCLGELIDLDQAV